MPEIEIVNNTNKPIYIMAEDEKIMIGGVEEFEIKKVTKFVIQERKGE